MNRNFQIFLSTHENLKVLLCGSFNIQCVFLGEASLKQARYRAGVMGLVLEDAHVGEVYISSHAHHN